MEFGSGSRLLARYYSAPGMPPVFAGFYDSTLGVPCDFLLGSDDELRCLPRPAALNSHFGSTNSDCTGDIWEGNPVCAEAPGYVREQLECADKFSVHRLTPYEGTSVYRGNASNCADEGPGPFENTFVMGPQVAPEKFVRGTLKVLPGVCRATLGVVEAEDGAYGPMQLFDVARMVACVASGGTCWPSRRAFEEPMFSDDMCTVETSNATWTNAASCAPPGLIRGISGDLYEPGPMVDEPVYSALTGACEPALNKPWIESIYSLGDRVDPEQLAEFTATRQGDKRLQALVISEGSTPLITDSSQFFDAESGDPCAVELFDDGQWRCIPAIEFGGHEDTYNDADCSEPVRTCQQEDCMGSILFDDTADPESCSAQRLVTAVWRVTTHATGYYTNYGGDGPCTELGEPQDYHWVVEPVDDSELASLELEHADQK